MQTLGLRFKSGTSTGTGSSQTIAHGLVSVPNVISVVPNDPSASVTGLYADDTNVYLTVTIDKDYTYVFIVL